MKIRLLTITHYATLYGANRSLLNLIDATRDQIDWTVIYKGQDGPSGSIATELRKRGVTCFAVPFIVDICLPKRTLRNNSLIHALTFLYNIFLALCMGVYARVRGFHYLHTNTTASCLGAYISFWSRIPHVWHFREFLDIDYHYTYKFGFGFLRFWANKAYRIIAISDVIAQKAVIQRGITATSCILYNGVISRANIPALKQIPLHQPRRLCIVGLLDPSKNQLEAIAALRILLTKGYELALDIVGEQQGAYYDLLCAYVQEHGLQQVVCFTGYVSDQSAIFLNADITLMCSPNEAMGRVTIESMAQGVPVVGYDSAGTSELIEHGVSGLLYAGGPEALAMAIASLLDDPILYRKLVVNGHRQVGERFSTENYAAGFLQLLANA